MEFLVKVDKYVDSLIFKKETNCDLYVCDKKYFVRGCKDQTEANDLIANHNPIKPAEPTIAEKLASVGLNLDELKSALGL